MDEAYRQFLDADRAWSAELRRLFGKRSGDVRYTKQGEGAPGSDLNAAYTAFIETGNAWRSLAFSR